ncbi:MAG TPA: TPM domain-containing protein, partial [Symbiobacteriaceae bacterium]|nr:TPM domain-containing protein [Symbiobacteriaceae bacterium]
MTRKPLLLMAWLCAMLILVGRPAAAAPSPAGIVTDDSGTFSAQQLVNLDQALSGLTYPFRVIVVNTAFPGGRPADAEAQFQLYADRLLQEQVPKDTVLITVSMQDRLVDFRVWSDGPVNQAFLAKTGRQFGDYSGAMLDAYRVPARAGDVPGGIIAAARVV